MQQAHCAPDTVTKISAVKRALILDGGQADLLPIGDDLFCRQMDGGFKPVGAIFTGLVCKVRRLGALFGDQWAFAAGTDATTLFPIWDFMRLVETIT